MDIQEKLTRLQVILGIPPVSDDYIVFPGETPWWEVKDYVERHRACTWQYKRMERKLHPEIHTEAMRKHRERYPKRSIEARRKSCEAMKRYNETPKGRATLAKHTATRREYSTDPISYAVRVELLHILQELCANCHNPYRITHQIDHILALCLGGTDDWNNLQPLCILCHREKMKEDIQKYISHKMNVPQASKVKYSGGRVMVSSRNWW